MMEAVNSQRCVKGELCHAAVRETNVVRVDSLGIEGELSSGRFGAKLQRLVDLVKTIPKSERILVFVQYEDLYPKVEEALGSARIEYATLQGSVKKRANTLDNFQSEEDGARLLLLKMNDASAAGSNLTTANHAIFLGPLCVPSLLEYRAVETQAIGRVRRFGQSRTVHVHRLFALDTIDMRIYESRSAELCAKPDYVELPKEEYVPRRKALHRRVSDDDVEMVLVE
jgi:SNF2 family DNA or RNA helicase